VIPVEVTTAPWHYTTFPEALDHWQTLIAGVLAFVAGFGTVGAAIWAIRATRSTAKEQIDASRVEADKVIRATQSQTETTVRLQEMRDRSEALAFHGMLAEAMVRVLNEALWARKTYPQFFPEDAAGLSSIDAYTVRRCITKGAFAELRAACVRRGGDLTGDFLDLEREIDSFALQYEPTRSPLRMGKHAGLDKQLTVIETKADVLRKKAFERFSGSMPPAPPRRSGGAVTGLP
jgi:hypothetical protein